MGSLSGPVRQRPPTFLAPGTGFCGIQVFHGPGWGIFWGWLYCVAFIAHFILSSLHELHPRLAGLRPQRLRTPALWHCPAPLGWLVPVELTLVAAPSSSSCLVPPTPVSHLWEGRGVSVSDLQRQNLHGSGHWCGGLSRRFSCLCVFPQKRESRHLRSGKLALDTCGYQALHHPPHRWCWSAWHHERDTSCILGGWSLPVQESKSTKSLL